MPKSSTATKGGSSWFDEEDEDLPRSSSPADTDGDGHITDAEYTAWADAGYPESGAGERVEFEDGAGSDDAPGGPVNVASGDGGVGAPQRDDQGAWWTGGDEVKVQGDDREAEGQFANADRDQDGVPDFYDDNEDTALRVASSAFGGLDGAAPLTGVTTNDIANDDGGYQLSDEEVAARNGDDGGPVARGGGGSGSGAPGSGGPDDRFDELQGYIDDFYGEAMPKLEGASDLADAEEAALFQQYLAEAGIANQPIEMPEWGEDLSSEAALAKADQRSIDAQYDALNRFKTLSDPTVTAKERFLMETARRAEERDRKSAMDAAFRDMEARGVRSGGAEIAALLGAQQTTSENRMLQDLGTQAGAVDRSMLALQNYGDLSGDIRRSSFDEKFNTGTAADVMKRYNRTGRTDFNIWLDDTRRQERDKRFVRAGDVFSAGTGVSGRKVGRAQDIYSAGRDEVGFRANTIEEQEDDEREEERDRLAAEEAEKAREALEDEDESSWREPHTKLEKIF